MDSGYVYFSKSLMEKLLILDLYFINYNSLKLSKLSIIFDVIINAHKS